MILKVLLRLNHEPVTQSPAYTVRQELVDRAGDYRTTVFSLFETMMVLHFKVD